MVSRISDLGLLVTSSKPNAGFPCLARKESLSEEQVKNLVLAKETSKNLDGKSLVDAAAGVEIGSKANCADTWYQCSTWCG
jgi:hypothetical protein